MIRYATMLASRKEVKFSNFLRKINGMIYLDGSFLKSLQIAVETTKIKDTVASGKMEMKMKRSLKTLC